MERELTGRIALVTGSIGGGMGRSIALTLAREGASIILNSGTNRKDPESALATVEAVHGLGAMVIHVEADTAKAEEVERMVATGIEKFGRIDILVNNAGSTWKQGDLTAITPERWRYVVESEINGMFYCLRAVLPSMRKHGWGRVITIGMADPLEWKGMALDCTYAKVCRALLMEGLAYEERGMITFNAIKPGRIEKIPLDRAIELVNQGRAWGKRTRPTPQDVAEVVAFLCSERGRFITGSTITVIGKHPQKDTMFF
ncbi:MAG: SDR family oxidoreductase [Candidatus Latescibacteria bacterium]|nr:SDR family oxidoreductase [Candidatus Latescibacterota bacterium]